MDENERIESVEEVKAYIQKLNYALDNGAVISVQINRRVDNNRDYRYTNEYTISDLFPDESPAEAMKRELRGLTVRDYRKTLKDTKHRELDEFREFGKKYDGKDVYIKIRVELVNAFGNNSVFVMSFHYAEYKLNEESFPYRGE